jgi:hypothetical protein
MEAEGSATVSPGADRTAQTGNGKGWLGCAPGHHGSSSCRRFTMPSSAGVSLSKIRAKPRRSQSLATSLRTSMFLLRLNGIGACSHQFRTRHGADASCSFPLHLSHSTALFVCWYYDRGRDRHAVLRSPVEDRGPKQ